MAYRVEPTESGEDLVVDGFEKGIADSPYGGISDMRNMNVISVPGEAAVSFATSQQSYAAFSGSIASADTGADTVTYTGETGTPIAGMCMVLAGGSLPTGLTAGTQAASADTNVYWIGNVNTGTKTFSLYTDFGLASLVNITGSGTGTFATIDIAQPKEYDRTLGQFIIDTNGRAWTVYGGLLYWRFMGNITRASASGNGIVFWKGYVFVFRNILIDYAPVTTFAWTYGWKSSTTSATHMAYASKVTGDTLYFCNGANVGSVLQNSQSVAFDPSTGSTFTFTAAAVYLPSYETSQAIAELGLNVIVGGAYNAAYLWNGTSTTYDFPIFIAENNIVNIITVNTNSYLFAGNRGRVYYTNGSQAQLFVKVPDHLSGTIEPFFTWGGGMSNRNQLYFSLLATTNGGATNSNYGGVWAVDLDTKTMRLTNQLSYGTYAGYATVLMPITSGQGFGFYAGWTSGASTYGMDVTSSTPYTNYQSYIDSDMIPVGTALKAKTFQQVEFKLSTPLVASEGVKISYRTNITESYTQIGETLYSATPPFANLSDVYIVNWEKVQWLQLRVNTKSTGTNPSYARLREIRIR